MKTPNSTTSCPPATLSETRRDGNDTTPVGGAADPPPTPGSARDWLDRLRTQLATEDEPPGGGGGDSEVERLLSGCTDAFEQTLAEHAGMAGELLCVYEQLGVVFEVTRKLSGVREEWEVVDLFVACLSPSFAHHEVFATGPERTGEATPDASQFEPSPWLNELIVGANDESRAVVARCPAGAMPPAVVEVMVAPILGKPACEEESEHGSGDSPAYAIVLAREEGGPVFKASDMLLLESLTRFCGDLIRNHRLVRELSEMSFALVRSLVSAVDQKDEYTSGHSLRVGYFSAILGRELGLGPRDLQMLQWSALLHDVGKIGIRDEVLKKRGKLSFDEFEHIKEHPVRSHRVVKEVPQLADALDGVLHHHEHFDGAGYPARLRGEAIPLQARIIQVADVFDALTSTRSYRREYDWETALDILKEEAGKTVDPAIQRTFDRLIRGTIGSGPDAWNQLVRTADQCPRVSPAPDGPTRLRVETQGGIT